jgi:outer membrane lipoprotein SlyB
MTYFKLGISLALFFTLQACSQQQVVSSAVSVATLPVKAAGAVAGTAGGIVGGTAGGLVAGSTGRKYGAMAGQRAARKAIP